VQTLARAAWPLLEELGYPLPQRPGDCRIGLRILPAASINAGVGPGSSSPCMLFTLAVTDGAVRRLSVEMLRAMLAHELGHVQLGHIQAKQSRAGTPAILQPLNRVFERTQEAEADRFAVDLLRRIEPRYPGSCMALVYVFALLADQPDSPSRWLASHPSPDRRAEAALAGCQVGAE
jgi:Zn-dependent protease with chaperone function